MRYKAAADVAQVVRQWTTLRNGLEYLDMENQVWVDFAEDVIPMKFPAAEFMATQLNAPTRLLDVAVLAVGAENARKFGVADRWHAHPEAR